MAMIKVAQGQRFIKRGEKLTDLYLVVQGKVRQILANNFLTMDSGNLIGLVECRDGIYHNDYMAEEESVLYSFPYKKPEDFIAIFEEQQKYAPAFLQAAIRQTVTLLEYYEIQKTQRKKFYTFVMEAYHQLCSWNSNFAKQEHMLHRIEEMEKTDFAEPFGDWEYKYFRALSELSIQDIDKFFKNGYDLIVGEIMRASIDMMYAVDAIDGIQKYLIYNREILLCENKTDLLTLYLEQGTIAAQKDENMAAVLQKLEEVKHFIARSGIFDDNLVKKRLAECSKFDFEAIRQKALEEKEILNQQESEEAEDCLAHILNYASFDEEKIERIRELVTAYRMLEDVYSTEDSVRRLRKELTNIFYDTYKKVFFRSVMDEEELTPILQMFLYFGFMDLQTVGEDNANTLYDMTDRLFECKSENIFTMYEWLLGIYEGRLEPSRNEFDMDYANFLHEQKRMGRITEAQEQEMRNDNREKVIFEIDNMFQPGNRATYGKISTFCPILSEHDIIGKIENMLVTVETLENAMNMIRKLDFSLFYQEVMFTDPLHGVNKEMIQQEIRPNIILMPNVGIRAMMWQETGGTKRNTPARFFFSILTSGNVDDMMIETCGRFRWEICRKIQGMRWNDITEKSLTSEYCDYVQFYRKNHDLSPDAREKIKSALVRAKNNYREVFVMDYANWIKYESNGSFRLNRIARDILLRYCPFQKSIRSSLADNPMYQDMLTRYNILLDKKKRHVTTFTDRYIRSGGEMTVELQENLEFYNM